jgi:hypothetical protein
MPNRDDRADKPQAAHVSRFFFTRRKRRGEYDLPDFRLEALRIRPIASEQKCITMVNWRPFNIIV